jgi:hypothetical protein
VFERGGNRLFIGVPGVYSIGLAEWKLGAV